MPGNLRKKLGKGQKEHSYVKARRRVLKNATICPECGNAIDTTLKSVCRFVPTDNVPVELAHTIPVDCGPDCRSLGHARKANPWSASADHRVAVADLPSGSPLLTSAKNLVAMHLLCNKRKGSGARGKSRGKVSRDWFL